jgi:hypothetical protein
MRTQYLYPVLVFGTVYAAIALYRKIPATNAMALLVALLAPVSLQVARTVAHTGNWGYLDKWATQWYLGPRHVTSTLYGYDTIVPAWAPPDPARPASNPDLVNLYDGAAAGYEGRLCFTDSHTGLLPALWHGNIKAALCLLVKRQSFYFGSYARLGLVYLPSPDMRVWSWWFWVLNLVALAITLYRLPISADRRVGALVLVWLSSIWLVATYCPPEQRFFATFHTAMWVIASATVWSRVARHLGPATRASDGAQYSLPS